jgi:CheY-like chemotaxis protein
VPGAINFFTVINTPKPHTQPPIPVTKSAPVVTKTILLVEDSPDDAFFFLNLLRTSQVPNPVVVVHDGQEAIAYLNREGRFADPKTSPVPAALFLDLKMPKVNGFEVLQWIKSQPHLKDLLVIILTHHSEVKIVNQAYSLGAHSYLTKPLTPKELGNLMTHFQPHFQGGGTRPNAEG